MKHKAVNKNIDFLKTQVAVLPNTPGVYQFFDNTEKIIYVGKAKDLKKRVSSYFTKTHDNRKTVLLVRNITSIKYMVVESEEDALLLENNLIKKYQPRYNIRLKDDKTYPWICIKNERFPRVFKTRNVIRDQSVYFGPYTSYQAVNVLLELIRKSFQLRNCNFNLSKENIEKKKFKVCLEYHLGNCLGPCGGYESEEHYNEGIEQIKGILKGNVISVIRHLQETMEKQAGEFQFEEAQKTKEKLATLERYQSRSTVVSATITDVDVFSIDENEKSAFINYLKIIRGAIIQTHTIEIAKRLDEKPDELLPMGIAEIRQKIFSNAKEILIPFDVGIELAGIKFRIPRKGDKKKLLDLSTRNAKYFRMEKEKQQFLANPQKRFDRILNTIQKDLHLKELPKRIECFDNSNLQGTNPVASCVVFVNTKPIKKEYRHFNIKTVVGANDFASMEEVVFRRYKRQLAEGNPLPQLVVIDGGKGQLSSAVTALERLNIRGKITIIGIAKKLEEIYFPDDSIPIYLNKNSETLKVLQQLRDEAHRFGITFHRNKRSNEMISTELNSINGIGKLTASKLLQKFKSVKSIQTKSVEELEKEIGKSKAKLVAEYFQNKKIERN